MKNKVFLLIPIIITGITIFSFKENSQNNKSSDSLVKVVSDGRNTNEFIDDLEKQGYGVAPWAKEMMGQKSFVTTNGNLYQLVIIFGNTLSDQKRTTSNIFRIAKERGYITPPAEVAPLLRERFSDEDLVKMNVRWLMIMHDLIKDSKGVPGFLGVGYDERGSWISAGDSPCGKWYSSYSFVFLVPFQDET